MPRDHTTRAAQQQTLTAELPLGTTLKVQTICTGVKREFSDL